MVALGVSIGLAGCGPAPKPGASPTPTSPPASRPPAATIDQRLRQALASGNERFAADEAFRRNRLSRFGFSDDTAGGLCESRTPTPPAELDFDRSFWVHDRATLGWVDPTPTADVPADFSLRSTLTALTKQIPATTAPPSAEQLFAAFWDTQNSVSVVPGGAQCTDDGGMVNGFRNDCRNVEGAQASDAAVQIGKYWPIGLVNRLDLAHEGWRNCGEHRIVYGRNDVTSESKIGRAFIIFEGVLPNPRPGCRSACLPVAEFWAGLSDPALSTAARARALRDFYYRGLPGFEPVVHIDHYTAQGVESVYGSSGSGQIRANMFLTFPWLLKEFRLSLDCGDDGCDLAFVPSTVKVTPFAQLWSAEVSHGSASTLQGLATAFQDDVVVNVRRLAAATDGICPDPASGGDINRITYPVDLRFDNAQSTILSNSSSDFRIPSTMPTPPPPPSFTFSDLLGGSPGRCGLSGSQLVKRAMTQTCAGCHDSGPEFALTASDAIGPVRLPDGTTATAWPASLGFVHTLEFPDPATQIHRLSPALLNVFLPERRRIAVEEMLNRDNCPCRETFAATLPSARQKFVSIEDKVTDRFAARIRTELERLKALGPSGNPKAPHTAEIRRVRARILALERERQQAVVRAVAAAGTKLPPLDRKLSAQATSFGFKQLAEGDPKRAAELRTNATNQFLISEPPRRTVSGSFRVH